MQSDSTYHMPLIPNPDSISENGLARGLGLRLWPFVGAILSFILLGTVLYHFHWSGVSQLWKDIPGPGLFWIAFSAFYLSVPLFEWGIYRRLWNIPADGLGALLQKYVTNELLLGYLGDAQFYAWARGRTRMTTAPFGAIKDVAVLSALAGNLATLVMLIFAWPLIFSQLLSANGRMVFVSLGIVLLTSMLIFVFRQKIFSLPKQDLRAIFVNHMARIVVSVGLCALMWHLLLPSVTIGLWFVLATLRMLVSRLPLLPGKDLLFASITTFLLGENIHVAETIALVAGLLLITHMAVGAIVATINLLRLRSEP
jgi:hypothetical protein